MDVVVFLADAAQGRTDFFVLLITELPGRDHIIRLKERVPRHEAVLGTPIVIPTKDKKFKLLPATI